MRRLSWIWSSSTCLLWTSLFGVSSTGKFLFFFVASVLHRGQPPHRFSCLASCACGAHFLPWVSVPVLAVAARSAASVHRFTVPDFRSFDFFHRCRCSILLRTLIPSQRRTRPEVSVPASPAQCLKIRVEQKK
jgi:hypothetical protein